MRGMPQPGRHPEFPASRAASYKVLMAALQSSYVPGMRQLGSSTAATGFARNFKPTYFEA